MAKVLRKTEKDNRGFALIELIVVVAILAVCAAMIGMSLSTAGAARVRKCANMTDALLSECKISAMSKSGPVYLRLYRTEGGDFRGELCEGGSPVSDELLGPSAMGVAVKAGGVESALDAGESLYVSFDRGTGALVRLNEVRDGGGNTLNTVFTSGYCTELTFSGGRTMTITLVPATGYHSIG